MLPRFRGKSNSNIEFQKASTYNNLLPNGLDAIESDKEGEDLITSSLQKIQNLRKINADLFENHDSSANKTPTNLNNKPGEEDVVE